MEEYECKCYQLFETLLLPKAEFKKRIIEKTDMARPAGIEYETKAKGMALLFLSMLIYKLIKTIIFPLHCKMNDISQDEF